MFRPLALGLAALLALTHPARAVPPETLESVVSVLLVWPNRPQGGQGAPPGTVPEGSGVVVRPGGVIATAWHVIEPAVRVDVRLGDGRVLPAEMIGQDPRSDVALLRIEEDLPPLRVAPEPPLAAPVCAIGNAYGLGLSVSCGVVSRLHVSQAGFNPVEDFVQTDAAVNPGSSGGALVDRQGRLVGLLSAIFASDGDANIGVNFAVSTRLLDRVVEDLLDDGRVDYVTAGWRLSRPGRPALARAAGALVRELAPDGAAAQAGLQVGDLIQRVGPRPVRQPRDAVGAIALARPGETVPVTVLRAGAPVDLSMTFPGALADGSGAAAPASDCPHPEPVCAARQAVFPIQAFDPLASAVRIAPDLMITNRHVVGDRESAVIITPDGPREAAVLPTAYRGDLSVLRVEGLPEDGVTLDPDATRGDWGEAPFFAVGADIARREIRVFPPGELILPPAEDAPLGRLHVTARMQPGVSGGALVDGAGRLAGIAVGGGEGRYEAIPPRDVRAALEGLEAPDAPKVQVALGKALVACSVAMDAARGEGGGPRMLPEPVARPIFEACGVSENAGQFLEAGSLLGQGGAYVGAIDLHQAAVTQVPNSINARISLLVSLQVGGRIDEMLPHARWLFAQAPDDPQAQRFAIQIGTWTENRDLAEAAFERLAATNPAQAQAARRFLDDPPPKPRPR